MLHVINTRQLSNIIKEPRTQKEMIVYFKWVNFMICELYLIKAVKGKKKKNEEKNGNVLQPPNTAKLKEQKI